MFSRNLPRFSSSRSRLTRRRRVTSVRTFWEPLEERIALANMIEVTTLLDTGNPSGTTSLRQAITQANTDAGGGDTITFDQGLFSSGPGTINLGTALPELSADMTITGPGSDKLTLKGGGTSNQFSVLRVAQSVSATISDMTISGGVSNVGGGIDNEGQLDLRSCVISGNSGTSDAGGIYNNGTMTLENCTVSGNTSKYSGGGISNNPSSATLTLTGCVVSGNSSGADGGIFNAGALTLTDTTISGNTAKDAAGIGNQGTLTISGSTLSGNTAENNGGALWMTGTARLTNSTVYNNTAAYGGGLDVYSGTLVLTNVTISNNNAGADAGGGLDVRTGSNVSLFNTIIAGNFSGSSKIPIGDVNGAVNSSSASNLIGDGDHMTGISNGSQGNQVGTTQSLIDAKLQSLAGNGGNTQTMALAFTSPARGTGNTALAVDPVTKDPLLFDQRGQGFPRVVNGKVDIGAFELQQATTSLAVGHEAGVYGGTISVSATLTSNGQPVSGETIAFVLKGKSLGTAVTNASGDATLPSVSLGSLGAGHYQNGITATFTATDQYLGSNGTGNLEVDRAHFIVTAQHATQPYGGPEAVLKYTITGFVNGDTIKVVTGTPSLHTEATVRSNVIFNPYPILVQEGSLSAANYDFPTLVDSTLIITPAPLTVTANNVSAKFGQAFPAFTASYVGFRNDDSPFTFKTPLSFSTTAHVGSLPGTYAITPFGASNPNYAIRFVPGTLTITSASGLTPDPSHPGKFILTIEGGPGQNQVIVTQAGGPRGVLLARLNGQIIQRIPASQLSLVVLVGGLQPNRLLVAPRVTVPSAIFGGPQPNILRGGRATTLIVGGPSSDLIRGGPSRDLLIGGGGFDRIAGGGGGDILVGGITAFDKNPGALAAILAEWTSNHSYRDRVSNITGTGSGPSFESRLNGDAFLTGTGPHPTVRTDVGFARIGARPGGNLIFRSTRPARF